MRASEFEEQKYPSPLQDGLRPRQQRQHLNPGDLRPSTLYAHPEETPVCKVAQCKYPAREGHPFCSKTCARIAEAHAPFCSVPQCKYPAREGHPFCSKTCARASNSAAHTPPPSGFPQPKDYEERLRGGEQRFRPRMEVIERLRQNTGDITIEEKEQLSTLLGLGHQVELSPSATTQQHVRVSSHPLSLRGVAESSRAAQSAPDLLQHLQDHGLAPVHPGDAAVAAIHKLFVYAGEKEAKKAAAITSYPEFVEFFRKAKVVTREMHDTDPESYWAMLWHSQSVQHIYCEHGWAVAGEYHRRVMKAWMEGFLDASSFVETEEFRRGDVEGALHHRILTISMHCKTSTSSGSTTRGGTPGRHHVVRLLSQEVPWPAC